MIAFIVLTIVKLCTLDEYCKIHSRGFVEWLSEPKLVKKKNMAKFCDCDVYLQHNILHFFRI